MGRLVLLAYAGSCTQPGLRLCLGAFRISPIESLYVDAHKPSLGVVRATLPL